MKVIALKNIILEKNTITYKFDIPEELRKHINMEYIDEHNQGTLFVRPQKEQCWNKQNIGVLYRWS